MRRMGRVVGAVSAVALTVALSLGGPGRSPAGAAEGGLTLDVDVTSVAGDRAEGTVAISGTTPKGKAISGSGTVVFKGRGDGGGLRAQGARVRYSVTVDGRAGSGTLNVAGRRRIAPGPLVITLGPGATGRVVGEVFEGTGI